MRNWHGNLSPFGKWHTGSSLAGALAAYAAAGITPQLVADFKTGTYGKAGALSTFGGVLEHSRAGLATMVDADGVLKWAPHNLVSYSEDFSNAAWSKSNSTVSGGVDDPFGGTSAYTLTATASNGQTLQSYGSAGTSAQFTNHIYIRRRTGTGPVSLFNPNGGGITAKSITSEWSVYEVVGFGSAGTNFTGVRLSTSGDEVDIAFGHSYRSDLGGMADNPATGNSYVPTTDAARYLPRENHHVYNGSAWVKEGYLHEPEAATNLVTYSQDFTDASWLKAKSITTLDAVGPDGVANSAATLVDNSAGGTNIIYARQNDITVLSGAITFSVFLKAGGLSWVALQGTNFGTSPIAFFDLSTGSVGTELAGGVGQIEDVGNGWFRCSLTFATTTDLLGDFIIYPATADNNAVVDLDGTSSILIYGAQIEQGSVPTSYIPTSGSTVTRAADILTLPIENIPYPTGDNLAVSFGYKALVTYADGDTSVSLSGSSGEFVAFSWLLDSSNYITDAVGTSGTQTGRVSFLQEALSVPDVVNSSDTAYSPGINVPMSLASRHGSTFINGAVDGTALTANTTPTAFPDLSTTDLVIAPSGGPQVIQEFIMWGGTTGDIGDVGIAETSA